MGSSERAFFTMTNEEATNEYLGVFADEIYNLARDCDERGDQEMATALLEITMVVRLEIAREFKEV